jgi:hypothetical protein
MEETADLDRVCQAVSPDGEQCTQPGAVHCTTCAKWFCDTHAEDEEWHACMRVAGEEGGEA